MFYDTVPVEQCVVLYKHVIGLTPSLDNMNLADMQCCPFIAVNSGQKSKVCSDEYMHFSFMMNYYLL